MFVIRHVIHNLQHLCIALANLKRLHSDNWIIKVFVI